MPKLIYTNNENGTFSDIFDIEILRKFLPETIDLWEVAQKDRYDEPLYYHDSVGNQELQAAKIWPKLERKILCHHAHMFASTELNEIYEHMKDSEAIQKNCKIFKDEPSKSFWNSYGIKSFPKHDSWSDKENEYKEMNTKNYNYIGHIGFSKHSFDFWKNGPFKNEKVIALSGPPARYPSEIQDLELSKYLVFNQKQKNWLKNFKIEKMGSKNAKYLAIHLRLDTDMQRACKSGMDYEKSIRGKWKAKRIYSKDQHRYLSSYQCLGSERKFDDIYDFSINGSGDSKGQKN